MVQTTSSDGDAFCLVLNKQNIIFNCWNIAETREICRHSVIHDAIIAFESVLNASICIDYI